LWAITVSLR